jgi:hypothetical protein
MDVQVPGMVYAAGCSRPISAAHRRAWTMPRRAGPGITDVVRLPDGSASSATTRGTQAAKGLLKVTWSNAPRPITTARRRSKRSPRSGAILPRGRAYDPKATPKPP